MPDEQAKQIVHVYGPPVKKPGMQTRLEFHFDPTDTPDEILSQLDQIKKSMGFVKSVPKMDDTKAVPIATKVPDQNSGFIFDHPETVVAIGHEGPKRTFVEDARIKGPPPEPPKPAA